MQKLGPGVYGKENKLHICEAEVCEHFGVPYTKENAEIVVRAVTDAYREHGWPLRVEYVEEPPQ
jgi:hypothetical protein